MRIAPNVHLEMMQYLDRWPRWPLLPLINRRSTEPLGKDGLLLDNPSVKYTVFYANLFLPFDPGTCEKKVYASFEEILADGWKVD